MPLPDKKDKDCVGKTIKIEEASGKPHAQAVAIALDHCGKSNKKDKKNEDGVGIVEIESLLDKINEKLDELFKMQNLLYSMKNVIDFGKKEGIKLKLEDIKAKIEEEINESKEFLNQIKEISNSFKK